MRERRSARPVTNARATPTNGTAAISSPVVELGSRVSALPRNTHGIAISTTVNSRSQRHRASSGRTAPLAIAIGSRMRAANAVRASTSSAGEISSTATLMSR